MVSHKTAIVLAASFARAVFAAAPLYGQCGGSGWAGDTTCVSGSCCQVSNEYYSQCLPCSGGGNPAPSPSTTAGGGVATSTVKTPAATGSFNNPVLWDDLADLDISRVGDAFYYSASTMAYSPGAPILRSYDLVNWEYIGHSVPKLDWGSKYDLAGNTRAYVKGIWASTMRYRPSNKKWYWIGCIEFGKTYVYTAPDVTGPWSLASTMNTCLYDVGLFIDDDDSMYVAYGNTQLRVAKLASDGLSITSDQQIYDGNSGGQSTLEGSRMYKRNGQYYVLVTHPANQEWTLKSSKPQSGYSIKVLANAVRPPVSGGGNPHQGGLVDTPNGDWYYMAFEDAYPGGRIPVLAPVTWGSDGFPSLTTSNGAWGTSYPMPLPAKPVASSIGTDSFNGTALGSPWEWNHNPDTTRYSVNNGLTLRTATVTNDLYQARNTLTRRIRGPVSTATIVLDTSNMADGDRAGLSLFRDQTGWIGVRNDGGTFTLAMVNGINLDSNWNTASTGTTSATAGATKGKIYLRGTVDIRPGGTRVGQFSYSTDGTSFKQLGNGLTLNNNWTYFIGYRWAIFNYATKALGGSVSVASFTQTVANA
ncbi:beta-xylosidase [Apiospora saccharicola]|uniref:Beta-xylosidase n=1 Tax=Apiospora saccharicola TaxID=335842 RepID=A0ABR1VPK7_9PEZI